MEKCNKIKRLKRPRNPCLVCLKPTPLKHCSKECQTITFDKNKKIKFDKHQSQFSDQTEGINFLICQICGFKAKELHMHVPTHGITNNAYMTKYNLETLKCQVICDRVKGSNNPAYQHGGKYSALSDKFIHVDKIDKQAIIDKISKSNKENGNNDTTISYWLIQTDGDEGEAKKLLSERQTTFSKEICIERFGEKQGLEVWKERQRKWHSNYKKTNFSKISQKLFWSLYEKIENIQDIRFAELGEEINNEEKLVLIDRVIKPDFIDLSQNRIIEFDGDYWHGKQQNPERETFRDLSINNSGYKVLHIKECDYKQDPKGTIDRCLIFLKQ